jgi:hypothetical protein
MGEHKRRRPLKPGEAKAKAIADMRFVMFKVAYDRMYAAEFDLTIRFANALLYSSRELTPEQELRAMTFGAELEACKVQQQERHGVEDLGDEPAAFEEDADYED